MGKGEKSLPYFISAKDSDYFAFAGLYEAWYDNKKVNSVKNNGKSCIEEASLINPRQGSLFA